MVQTTPVWAQKAFVALTRGGGGKLNCYKNLFCVRKLLAERDLAKPETSTLAAKTGGANQFFAAKVVPSKIVPNGEEKG